MGCLFSKRFSRGEERPEFKPQTFNVTGVGGEDTEANTVNVRGIHNETIINTDTETAVKHKLRTLENKIKSQQRQLNERESQIKKLENDIIQQQAKAELKDTEDIQNQIGQLHEKVNMHRSEIARLENEVLPDLMGQRDEVKAQLEKHEQNAQGKMEEVAVLNEKMQKLTEELQEYGTDVARERAKVEDLYSEIGKLKKDFKKIKSDQMTAVQEMMTEMETIKAAQAKQSKETQNLQDEMREQRDLHQQMEKQHDQMEKQLRKQQDLLKEEKMTREAAERKIQELEERDAGLMGTSQVSGDLKTGPAYQQAGDEAKQHGASSDVNERGSTATVRQAGGSIPRQVTQKDSNPRHVDDLLAACLDGKMAEVKRVLDLGQVDVNSRGRWSQTPVMVAAVGRHRDVVELLLSRGADVSLVDEDGNNTLHWACYSGDMGTVELILSLDVVDVNSRGEWSQTPVMEAAGQGRRDVVELLQSRGADVSLVDKGGNNTLHWACYSGDMGTVELILSLDVVDVNSRGERSLTPVMEAAGQGHTDVVKLLVRRGADVSLVDGGGNNILYLACYSGDVGTVELILSLDVVDVNVRNNDGGGSGRRGERRATSSTGGSPGVTWCSVKSCVVGAGSDGEGVVTDTDVVCAIHVVVFTLWDQG